jgi:hypothetical protein
MLLAMPTEPPRIKPAQRDGELDETQLSVVTGGTDSTPPPQPTQSNLQKKLGDTSQGLVQNIK